MGKKLDRMYEPISTIMRKDFFTLHQKLSVKQTFDEIRAHGLGERIIYFYVINEDNDLAGVVPTRRLLTASMNQPLSEVMIKKVVTVSQTATILEAHELLAEHKFLALPVVDDDQHIVGIVDLGMFTEMEFEIAEREQMDVVFEFIGFQVWQVRDASPFQAFRIRFPWLLSTIGSGVICALLVSVFEDTLSKSIILAFFLALVLGLGESVSIQSMTVTIQALRVKQPTLQWYSKALRRETGTAVILGASCGFFITLIVGFWHGMGIEAGIIGSSIAVALVAASIFGLSIPTLLHALKIDPKIAAGPITLAITDICTIFLYFTIAKILL